MNQHTARPACYLESGDPPPRAPGFRDNGRYCYAADAEVERLTPGCRWCRRRAPRD